MAKPIQMLKELTRDDKAGYAGWSIKLRNALIAHRSELDTVLEVISGQNRGSKWKNRKRQGGLDAVYSESDYVLDLRDFELSHEALPFKRSTRIFGECLLTSATRSQRSRCHS